MFIPAFAAFIICWCVIVGVAMVLIAGSLRDQELWLLLILAIAISALGPIAKRLRRR